MVMLDGRGIVVLGLFWARAVEAELLPQLFQLSHVGVDQPVPAPVRQPLAQHTLALIHNKPTIIDRENETRMASILDWSVGGARRGDFHRPSAIVAAARAAKLAEVLLVLSAVCAGPIHTIRKVCRLNPALARAQTYSGAVQCGRDTKLLFRTGQRQFRTGALPAIASILTAAPEVAAAGAMQSPGLALRYSR